MKYVGRKMVCARTTLILLNGTVRTSEARRERAVYSKAAGTLFAATGGHYRALSTTESGELMFETNIREVKPRGIQDIMKLAHPILSEEAI